MNVVDAHCEMRWFSNGGVIYFTANSMNRADGKDYMFGVIPEFDDLGDAFTIAAVLQLKATVEPKITPICLIPGMTREYPVFARLVPLLHDSIVSDFIQPVADESIRSYAERMAKQFTLDSYIVGVSFGGIIALEIARIVRPKGCVLISSIRHPDQLPPWFRICRKIGTRNSSALLRMVGATATLLPNRVSTKSTIRVRKLSGQGGQWHRWATSAVLDWKPGPIDFPLLQIHGDADTTFPIRYIRPDVSIRHGRHALPVSHPNETANAINAFTEYIQ